MPRRVVITGLGPVTPIGIGKTAFWDALTRGESGADRVDDLIDLTGIDVLIGCPIRSFDPKNYMDPKRARRLDRSTQFAIAAASLAVSDAGIDPVVLSDDRTGVVAGTGIGGLETLEENLETIREKGARRISPFFVPRMMPNASAGEVSIEHGLRGVNFGVVSACASGAHAIALSYELILSGLLDRALAGGSEAVLRPVTYAGFARIGAVSKRNDEPKRASRPFDRDRDGFVMGEGAGYLVIESLESAAERGAHIYAEIVGSGMTGDASHITAPCEDGDGAYRAMRMAIERAGLQPDDIQYVNAHGTSTQLNDKAETIAVKRALGDVAHRVKISSTKSQTGHLIGAAGSVEAIATVLSMENGFIPATLNYENPDPDCDLDYTPESLTQPIRIALSNSFGFGGQNACLAFVREDAESDDSRRQPH